MALAGRRRSIAFFIALGAGMISFILALYVGWVILNWHTGILLFLGTLMLAAIVSGVVLNTTFLVREIRRNEQHDSFINSVTHELKTPVASIRLYLETLQKRPVDEEKRKDFYRIMLEDSDRLMATIEQVLRAGRMGASDHNPNLARVEVNELVAACIEKARTVHGAAADSVAFHPGPAVATLANLEDMRAAVTNLIDNALKYSGKDAQVSVETDVIEGKFVTVRVRDAGPGIPRHELKQVFKRFYRIPGPLASRVKGTGLGLFIVRAVAKRHGGRVWAESEGPGRGSTFVLQVPIRT